MKRKSMLLPLLLAVLAGLLLSACGLYEKEYVVVQDYVPTATSTPDEDSVSVSDFSELKSTIRTLVSSGATEGILIFSENYEGNPTDDMASACWQIRTQDALCAYCVENISYELSHIVTSSEATLRVTYSEATVPLNEIYQLQYSTGLPEIFDEAIRSGATRLAILVYHSTYTGPEIESMVQEAYWSDPVSSPCEPVAAASLYSGANNQKLYEVELSYPLSEPTLSARREILQKLDLFTEEEKNGTDAQRALTACHYLIDGVKETDPECDTIYDALVEGKASPKGMAFAYKALCNQLNLSCQIVQGRYDSEERYWNVVQIGDDWFHVDVFACSEEGLEAGFLRNDTQMWNAYRWDVSSVPACNGELIPDDPSDSEEELPPGEESTEETSEELPKESAEQAAEETPDGTQNEPEEKSWEETQGKTVKTTLARNQ